MNINLTCAIALFGWIPLILTMFALLKPRTAVIYGFIVAWLFLPMAHVPLHGLTDYNKMSAAGFGVLLGALIFDTGTILAFRPKLIDLPMVIWCVCPLLSSIHNGLGAYDGIAAIAYQTTDWGLPYFIGRLYFNDLAGLRELATGILIGGLLYVPLCAFEVRFSPQLHRLIYGFNQHDFAQTRRGDSWRPMVFMQHGLAVGMWMSAASLCAFWLWWTGTLKQVWGMPMWLVTLVLAFTTYKCHSSGATMLLFVGCGVLLATKYVKWPVWVLLLATVPPLYMYERGSGNFKGDDAVKWISTHYDEDRARSLRTRFYNENLYVGKALQSPTYGWGGWNRFAATDANGKVVGVPDGFWIIAFGHNGWIGLIAVTGAILGPMLLLLWKIPAKYWSLPSVAPAAALAVLLGLHMIDNLLNAMLNPIFILGAGGIAGLSLLARGPVQAANPQPSRTPSLQDPGPRTPLPARAA